MDEVKVEMAVEEVAAEEVVVAMVDEEVTMVDEVVVAMEEVGVAMVDEVVAMVDEVVVAMVDEVVALVAEVVVEVYIAKLLVEGMGAGMQTPALTSTKSLVAVIPMMISPLRLLKIQW